MEKKLNYRLSQLELALEDFLQALKIDLSSFPLEIADVVKSGQIQKFEFSTELLWKTVKVYLFENHGFDEKSPKTVIKRYFSLDFLELDEYEKIMDCLDDRNLLSHTYDKKQYEDIYKRIITSAPLYFSILNQLKEV